MSVYVNNKSPRCKNHVTWTLSLPLCELTRNSQLAFAPALLWILNAPYAAWMADEATAKISSYSSIWQLHLSNDADNTTKRKPLTPSTPIQL